MSLHIDHLTYIYPDYPEFRFHIDISLKDNKFYIISGPSGGGKSTLFYLLSGFLTPHSGRIIYNDTDITQAPIAARPFSLLFQQNNLFHHLTVLENMALGLGTTTKLRGAEKEKLLLLATRFAIQDKLDAYPHQLSGGQASRVALARALLFDKPMLLLDEPFSALGPSQRQEFSFLLKDLQAQKNLTIFLISHQPNDARDCADELIFIDQGMVCEYGPLKDCLNHPKTKSLQAYLG